MGRVSLRSFSKLGHFEVEQKQHSNELRRKDNPKVIMRSKRSLDVILRNLKYTVIEHVHTRMFKKLKSYSRDMQTDLISC